MYINVYKYLIVQTQYSSCMFITTDIFIHVCAFVGFVTISN